MILGRHHSVLTCGGQHPDKPHRAITSMDMIFCPPGSFMRAKKPSPGRDQHQVTLTNGFTWVSMVTQAQYETVMTGNRRLKCRLEAGKTIKPSS